MIKSCKPRIKENFSANGGISLTKEEGLLAGRLAQLDWQEQRPFVPVDQSYNSFQKILLTHLYITFSPFCAFVVCKQFNHTVQNHIDLYLCSD